MSGQDEGRGRALFDANPQPTWVQERATGRFLDANRAMVDVLEVPRAELLAMRVNDLLDDPASAELVALLDGADPLRQSGPWELPRRGGAPLVCAVTTTDLHLGGQPARLVIAEDIAEHLRTQRAIVQAQRMESLGQLAGGIAHDFNNVLTVILNQAELVREELEQAATDDPARFGVLVDDVGQIVDAGRRATALTRQLLAFARGSPTGSERTDVNDAVNGVLDMLRRTMPGGLQLEVALAPGLPPIATGRGQLEQVVLNLAVNARDAMPGGGRLLIETSLVELSADDIVDRPGLAPGPHVRLRVSDTGTGMDAETRERALEPFFTTKPGGAGTGLGLATVYGIVRDAGGAVHLYSELGLGTAVTVLLPVRDGPSRVPVAPAARPRPARAVTALVVDDEDAVREVSTRILRDAGYRVLSAADGATALSLAAAEPGGIALLVTDMVMPGMSGRELAARLYAADPAVRVVFTSGYAPRLLGEAGALPPEAPVVEKPFSRRELLDAARAVLHPR